ncbi:MAG: polysaccharide biosynthesis protein [Actinobacteria bacterium]|nr:polysaccharide biosynthesis protein [Actinomycetota bacterium]
MPRQDPVLIAKQRVHKSRIVQGALVMLVDGMAVAVAVFLAYFARFEGMVPVVFSRNIIEFTLAAVLVYLVALRVFGLYHVVLRYVGAEVMFRLGAAVGAGTLLLLSGNAILSPPGSANLVPYGVVVITGAFALLGLGVLRSVGRLWVVMNRPREHTGKRVLVVGAGDAGSLLLNDIDNQPGLGLRVVGLLDDDFGKHGMTIRGRRILGGIDDLERVVAEQSVDEIFVAIPSMPPERKREVLDLCTRAGKKTRIIPSLVLYDDDEFSGLADLRQVSIEDLLGREPVEIDVELISSSLTGKVIAVTGAAGSIGAELCRQILKMRPKRLMLLEIDESRLYEMYLECEQAAPGIASMHICDVRDDRKVERLFARERPDMVFHAAAYKHVPLLEMEPDEAVRANVAGTMNVLEACGKCGAEHFVLISTDKAVEPANVMGATKAVAERVMLEAARRGLRVTAVRFGNVLGSRGSVVPIFEEQLRGGGPIRVTHPDVTRYFMTIPEAARLVLQAQAMSDGGDIFVLDMGEPVKIVELAQRMIVLSGVQCGIEFTGLRPGEKMHEILVRGGSQLVETKCPSVTRLNCLPLVGDGYIDAVCALVREAQMGESPLLLPMLCELAAASLGEKADGVCVRVEA